jgi:hypothetical protein
MRLRQSNAFDVLSADPKLLTKDEAIEATWSLRNEGRSPAWLLESLLLFTFIPEPPPDDPAYPDTTTIYPGGYPLAVGEELTQAPMRIAVRASDTAPVTEGATTLRFFGFVKYRDVFGTVYERRFCWQWGPDPGCPRRLLYSVGGPESWNRDVQVQGSGVA